MYTISVLMDLLEDAGYLLSEVQINDVLVTGETTTGSISGASYLELRDRLLDIPRMANNARVEKSQTVLSLSYNMESKYTCTLDFTFTFHALGTYFSISPKRVTFISSVSGGNYDVPTFALAEEMLKREREVLHFEKSVNIPS
jgi:hypothetical protein